MYTLVEDSFTPSTGAKYVAVTAEGMAFRNWRLIAHQTPAAK
jgi:hypothetical protein